jgi:peptidoglycan/LPS O-acetylase OafA/YrhL
VRFYELLARRILPAVFVVLAASATGAWVWLSPADLRLFAVDLTAA